MKVNCSHFHLHHHEKPKPSPLMDTIVAITRVALATFAIITNWMLFLGGFAAGLLLGVYNTIKENKKCVHIEEAVGGCQEGTLEKLAGGKLPDFAAFLLGGATLACHIEHHAMVFVPAVGISMGLWTYNLAQKAFTHIKDLKDKPVMA